MNKAPIAQHGVAAALLLVLAQIKKDIARLGPDGAWEQFCIRNDKYIAACEAKEMFGIGPEIEDLCFRAALMIVTVIFNTGEIEDATKMA